MHAQIVLDNLQKTWTNLDVLKGRIRLQIFTPTPLTSIIVKLEGESRTKLRLNPGAVDGSEPLAIEKPMSREETHKILYRTVTVLPGQTNPFAATRNFEVLTPGQYEYPFQFKFPFNNACEEKGPSAAANVARFARVGAKGVIAPVLHIKKTLPPTLTTFPGLAEIRYFLKCTVKRKEFYKENPRPVFNLSFLPIEPPRKAVSTSETFARRKHQFMPFNPTAAKGKSRVFAGLKKSSWEPSSDSTPAPHISLDVRLPSPAILTCNDSVPMRILVTRLNESQEPLFLQSLHMQLHGLTTIRANELRQEESSNWVIYSQSNMGISLRGTNAKKVLEPGEEITIDSMLWKNRPLPNSVAPSFETCNIKRTYFLEVHVGIGFRNAHANNTTVLPLRHAVQVYSGIAPPAALLATMAANASQSTSQTPLAQPVRPEARPEKSSAMGTPAHLRTEARPNVPTSIIPPTSQPGPSTPIGPMSPQYAPLPAGEEEPPPSYEDAIAQDLPPLDGPRRNYEQPDAQGERGFGDSKSRRDS